MQENPYSAILQTIRRDSGERMIDAWRLGKVISVKPLVIETADQKLQEKDLLVNYQLVENEENITLSAISGSLVTGDGGIGVLNGMLQAEGLFGGVLQPDDQVVLLQNNEGQKFVVLCKVVEPQ